MAKHAIPIPFTNIPLNPAEEVPLYRQLYDGLREAILTGKLAGNTRLPSTRTLSQELGISRNTVMTAFEQLLAEGYLQGKVGAGTYISDVLPDDLLSPVTRKKAVPKRSASNRGLSERGKVLAGSPVSISRDHGRDSGKPRAFQTGLPALDVFPFEIWARLLARRWRRPTLNMLGYGEPEGFKPLREAIAGYLSAARAVRCSPEQVIVVGGSQQALDLATRLLLDPGDAAWVEDPCYAGARGSLQGAEAQVISVPVDEEGIDIAAGMRKCPEAKMVYITPSHQYPLGVTMTLTRRLALLEWASKAGAWVLEDDYDSEFRYCGKPLAALHGLDSDNRVIYIGTFSKVLLPSLRLGYIVVPPDLVDAFVGARALADRHSPQLEQAVLTDFINEGHFSRHIRRMRALYAERQEAVIEAVRAYASGLIEVRPTEAGMHMVGWLPDHLTDREASQKAAQAGVTATPLSAYTIDLQRKNGLLLGFSAVPPKDLREGMKKLVKALS
ncbi:MAG: PLP-dependent aminotransferase family protein [Blastocatellia bacterium]|nr:PLP-dependent aminotransferase family protein [Blastocatellia bacterium]